MHNQREILLLKNSRDTRELEISSLYGRQYRGRLCITDLKDAERSRFLLDDNFGGHRNIINVHKKCAA